MTFTRSRVVRLAFSSLVLAVLSAVLTVQAQQQVNTKDMKVVAEVKELPSKSKRWALIIGVSKYEQGANFQELRGPDNDAKALRDALVKYAGFPGYQVRVMTTDAADPRMRPTRTNVFRMLTEITHKLDKDGLFLFAFSGHGMITPDGEGVLAAQNTACLADSNYLRNEGVLVAEIQKSINASEVKQRIILLDACRNNPMPGAKGAGDHNPMSDGFRLDLANRNVEAYVTLYATRLGYEAYENLERGRGYFMEAVVEALSGKAGYDPKTGGVTLGRLLDYVENNVRERSIKEGTPTVQEPFHSDNGRLSQDLVLAYVASANPEAVAEEEWDKIRDSSDANLFKEFERKFPANKHAAEAAWRGIGKSNNCADYKSYQSKYPKSDYADTAGILADDCSWGEADRGKSVESYWSYLKEYQNGSHASQARDQLEDIVWREAIKNQEFRSYLSQYPQGRYSDQARERIEDTVWREAVKKQDFQFYLNAYREGRYSEEAKSKLQRSATTTALVAPPPAVLPVLSVFTNPPVPGAKVVITPKAPGAKVVEGQIDAAGTFSNELAAGLYDIEVTAAKYRAERRTAFKVEKSGPITIEMTPLTGSILIVPVDPDATVYLDGQKPVNLRANSKDRLIEISDVPVGPHKVRVVAKNAQLSTNSLEREVEVVGGQQVRVVTDFKPAATVAAAPTTGILSIGVNVPTARVTITSRATGFHGEKLASSSDRFELDPGAYDVEVSADKYRLWKQAVFINAGDIKTLPVTLERNTIQLTAKGPPGASIFLDGGFKGTITGTGELILTEIIPGTHTIEATMTGFKKFSQPKEFTTNETVNLSLERIVADTSSWSEDFENLDYWDAPRSWALGWKELKNVVVSGTEVGLEKRGDYDDFELEFNVNILKGKQAAWVVRATDTKNYYIFVLDRTKERTRLYVSTSKEGKLSALSRLGGDFYGELPDQVHVFVTAAGKDIRTELALADRRQLLGIFSGAKDFPIGRFGFRAAAEGDQFVVLDLQCRPKK